MMAYAISNGEGILLEYGVKEFSKLCQLFDEFPIGSTLIVSDKRELMNTGD